MDKNNLEKAEKSRNTIEITIPFNGVVSESKKCSISPNTGMSNMNSEDNDDNSKKEQISNQLDSSDNSDDTTSKKEQMSSQSDASDSSADTTSKKEQIIINISH
jgi:hypothetical protein